jgi:hypothetical protein
VGPLSEGQTYRARPFRWDVRETLSGAVRINFTYVITGQRAYDGAWVDTDQNPEIEGDIWIMGKDQNIRQDAVEKLVQALGWNRSWGQLDGSEPWEPKECEITTELDKWKDRNRIRVGRINPLDLPPGAQPMSDENRARLRTKFLNAMTKPPPPKDDGKGPLAGSDIPF